jgi:hypothetical protein
VIHPLDDLKIMAWKESCELGEMPFPADGLRIVLGGFRSAGRYDENLFQWGTLPRGLNSITTFRFSRKGMRNLRGVSLRSVFM